MELWKTSEKETRLREKNKKGVIILPDFKPCYQRDSKQSFINWTDTMIIKTKWGALIYSHTYDQLIYDKRLKRVQMNKG